MKRISSYRIIMWRREREDQIQVQRVGRALLFDCASARASTKWFLHEVDNRPHHMPAPACRDTCETVNRQTPTGEIKMDRSRETE